MAKKKVQEVIYTKELELKKLKHIRLAFPDVVTNGEEFYSASLNKNYTNLKFYSSYDLYACPYTVLDFDTGTKIETVTIYSNPKKILIARLRWVPSKRKNVITFCRLKFNMKSHDFDEKIIPECLKEIVKWISKHSRFRY